MDNVNHTVSADAAARLLPQAVEDFRGRIEHAIEKGPLPSVQVALALDGELALFETFGAQSPDSRYCIFSCTKPLVASAMWRLMGEGVIDIERPVCDYFEEFADNGKEGVTVLQLLYHASGFPSAKMAAPNWWTREDRVRTIASWYLEWQPGSQMVYHPASAHWVLAELIDRLTGRDYREYIRDTITNPLGLPGFTLGLAAANEGVVARLEHVGESPTAEELADLFGASVDWPDTRDDSLLVFNDPEVRALGVPGGGAVASAADVALFYQALMRNKDQLWDSAILEDAIGRVRMDFPDPITGVPANRGLGVVIAGEGSERAYRGMGQNVSSRAFGHQGVGGQVSWGDPASGLSFCMLTNGLDANPIRSARFCAAVNNRAGATINPPD